MNPTRLDEISRILHTSRDVRSFYQHFLALSANMSGAQTGVAWRGDKAPFQPICQVQDRSAPTAKVSISQQRHDELLERAVASEKAFVVLPAESADEPVLMFGTVKRDTHTEVVEFVIPPGTETEKHEEIVEQLDVYCSIAAGFREPDIYDQRIEASGKSTGDVIKSFRPLSREAIDQYAHQVHRSLDYRETAANVANETRRVLDCDRVSVVLRRGNDYRIIAISGQPSVNRRSNNVSLLNSLAAKTLKTKGAFWYPDDDGTERNIAPQIAKPLNEYLAISSTRSLAILPVFDQVEMDDADPQSSQRRRRPDVIAGIIVEHCNEQWNRQLVAPSIETLTRHAGDGLRNALGHRQLFGYWLWRLLGKSNVIVAARNLPKTLTVVGSLAALTLVLCLVPAPFTLNCNGILLPEARSRVYASQNGVVSELNVAHGDYVSLDSPLLTLENEDIAIELEEVAAEIQRQEQRLERNRTLRTARDSERRASLEDNVRSIEAQIETLKRREMLLSEKSRKLNIVSPINGQVITWDVADRLQDRPVQTGETLLEVADTDGEWELELQLPARRAGHLLDALEQDKVARGEGLLVTYQLIAEPGQTFEGRVREFSLTSQLTSDQQQTVKVNVRINVDDIGRLKQARSGVSARIHCGSESLGYVWLHDVYEFVQSRVFFRLW